MSNNTYAIMSQFQFDSSCRPICGHNFPPDDLEEHASECGER